MTICKEYEKINSACACQQNHCFADKFQSKGKNMKLPFLFVLSFLLLFCTFPSLSAQSNYAKEARQHEFEYYFPAISGERAFDNLDAAFTYMNEAMAKFNQVSGKQRAKGGGGTLTGPVQNIRNVRIQYSIKPYGKDGMPIALDKTADIQKEIKNNVMAELVFLIFTNKKSACVTSYYLKSGYRFATNFKQSQFTAYNVKYTADYPSGWNVNKVYDYLKE